MVVVSNLMVATGLIVGNALLAWLHVATTGLSPLRDPISRYGLSHYATLYRWHLATFVVSGAGAALIVAQHFGYSRTFTACCALFMVSCVLVGTFPMDHRGAPRTRSGALHIAGAVLMFAAVFGALLTLRQLAGAKATVVATVDEWLLVVGIVGMIASKLAQSKWFGLIERLAAAGISGWLIAVLFSAR